MGLERKRSGAKGGKAMCALLGTALQRKYTCFTLNDCFERHSRGKKCLG